MAPAVSNLGFIYCRSVRLVQLHVAIAAALVAIAMMSLGSLEGEGQSMRLPPPQTEKSERSVDEKDAQVLSCAAMARRLASSYELSSLTSEKLTYSDAFGYIFRYDIAQVVSDDEESITIDLVLVVSSRDCQSFKAVTYSKFELPRPG